MYGVPYDPRFPVLCYDERPCFLIGELVTGLQMKAGQVRREHYAYEKHGSCNLLATIEPLSGRRIVDIFDQRRKCEFALAQKFEFYYTPPKASWLNMIEIEFSAIARLCLDRRIPTKEESECEVLAIVKERAAKAVKIEWQFSIEKSRKKLKRHYEQVNNDNSKSYKI